MEIGDKVLCMIKFHGGDKNKNKDGAQNVDWIKYHSQLQTTNNIIYVCLSSGLP